MGNNDSLPPPPPPGNQPQYPPAQPAGPPAYTPPPQQYTPPPYNPAPEYPPTQQMPPAQAYAPQPTQGFPQQPYVQGYDPNTPPPKKKNNGLLIGGGVAALAAIVGGVVVFAGGDDDKGSVGNQTTVSVATTIDAASTTLAPETTLAPNTTLAITVPPATDPPNTDAPATTLSTEGSVQTLFDDNGVFSMVLPSTFQTATTPITTDAGVTYSRIVGSADLTAYAESEDTFGIFVLIGESATAGTPTAVINSLDPGTDVCPDGVNTTVETSAGTAEVLQLDGCGTGGGFAKVFMAIELPAQGLVVVAVAQGAGPANGSLQEFTQAVFETVRLV